MKKVSFLPALLLLQLCAFGQILNIPDVNFKAKLLNNGSATIDPNPMVFNYGADLNGDGEVQISEAASITGLNVSTSNFNTSADILSLEGIQYFTNLKVLICNGNQIVNLDVSMLTALKNLECSYNPIQNLNVTGLSNLTELRCNHNQLSQIDTTGLNNLQLLYCIYNNLTSLDFSELTNLTDLQFDYNSVSNLTFGNNSAISTLSCANNLLTALDLQHLPNLVTFWADSNMITSMNLNGLNALQYLFVSNNALTEVDASLSNQLFYVDCSNNPNLTSINVRNNLISSGDPDLLFFPFHFENLPLLTSICLDDGEQNYLINTNYNSSGNVTIYGGPDCNIPLQINVNGINGFDLERNFTIYPNPAYESVTIENKSNIVIQSTTLYNTLGQLIQTIPTTFKNTPTFDISSLKTGAYYINITTDRGKTTKRFMKL